jgi:putative Flp pilus-assembly TadE/G-like protein
MMTSRPNSADRQTRRALAAEREQGSVSVFLIIILVGVFAVFGLVVDGAGKVRTAQTAAATADEAARAAGQALDTGRVYSGASPRPDTAAAARAARAYLRAAGVTGTVTVSGSTIHVTTRVTYRPKFLSAAGFGPWTLAGDATARPLRGILSEQGATP